MERVVTSRPYNVLGIKCIEAFGLIPFCPCRPAPTHERKYCFPNNYCSFIYNFFGNS